MVYKRYYSPFEEKPVSKNNSSLPLSYANESNNKKAVAKGNSNGFELFNKISSDDLIILGILLILLSEEKENRDIPLILALGFLFIVQYIEAD